MSRWKEQRDAEAKPGEDAAEIPTLEDFEEGAASDMERLHQAFRDRAAKEQKRVFDAVDSNYYFVVCFSNNEQLIEFCQTVGLNPDEIYIDGRQFAKKINRALKTSDSDFPRVKAFDREWTQRARDKA